MSFRFETEQWQSACVAFDNGEYETSIKMFINIADNSKIHFNIGLIFAIADEHDRAIASFTKAIELDPYLAVAYFQRGVSYFIQNKMEAAEASFDQTYERLRGNSIINYHQLGLSFKLYACEALFNRGICKLYLGKIDAGLTDLYYAQKGIQIPEHNVIKQAVRERGKGYSVFSLPPSVLFRPTESRLRQLNGGMFAAVDQLGLKKPIPKNHSILLDQRPSYKYSFSKPLSSSSYASPTSSFNRFFPRKNDSGIYQSDDSTASSTSSRYTRGADSGFESSTEDRYSSSPKTSSKLAFQCSSKEEDEGYGDFDKELEEVYGSINTMSLEQETEWHKKQQQRWSPQENLLHQPSASTSSNSTAGKLKIKVHYKDTRILLVSNTISFEELKLRIQEKFNAPSSILLKYKDEEDEQVLLIDDDDLQIARQVCRHSNTKGYDLEKLELWCVDI